MTPNQRCSLATLGGLASLGGSGSLTSLSGGGSLGLGLHHVLGHGGALAAVDHNGEALVVAEGSALGEAGHLLGSRGSFPSLLHVGSLPGLEDGASAGTSLDLDRELGQSEATEGHDHAGETGTINEDLLVVQEINDDAQFAVISSEVNIAHAASLNVSSEHLKSQGVVLIKLLRFLWLQENYYAPY